MQFGQNSQFIYIWLYLQMPKDFGYCYMKIFDIAKNLIAKGMWVQNFKAIGQKSSPRSIYLFIYLFIYLYISIMSLITQAFITKNIRITRYYFIFPVPGKKGKK